MSLRCTNSASRLTAMAILAGMPAPLTPTSHAADFSAWHELEEVLAELGALARSHAAPHEFYRQALEQSLRALSAVGGAVWLRNESGSLQPIVHVNWRPLSDSADEDARHAHEAVLQTAAQEGRIVSVPPRSAAKPSVVEAPGDGMLLVAPVQVQRDGATSSSATLAIVEILARPDASPGAYRGHEQFLAAVCDVAADYHAFRELERLRQIESHREQLLRFGRAAHARLDLARVAFAVANDGRLVIGCDRLNVLQMVAGTTRCKLLATSGAQRVDRRSEAARHLEQLAAFVGRLGEPAYYADGQSDAFPQIAEALEAHAEASHARQIAVVPIRPPLDQAAAEFGDASGKLASTSIEFILIAEQFDARQGDLHRERLIEVAEVAATALANAAAIKRLPLVWLLRPLGAVKQRVTARWSRSALVLATAIAAIAALILVRTDFNVEAMGTLQPVVRRAAFAPRSGLVEAVLVKHGEDVTAGQALLQLRDPALDLEIKRVHGELETAQRQIDAVRAAKTGRAIRDANPADTYRLSAEERELDQRLANLRREIQLLDEEAKKLVVTSPVAGRVLTWDIDGRLMARPVERGEALVTVADFSAPWQLELDVPDDQIGHVLAAQREFGAELPVRYRLSSDQGETAPADGRVAEVCRTADVSSEPGAPPTPTVRVNVAIDAEQLSDSARAELRPGISTRAQIACGRASLGYVWLHDIWDAVIGWLRF
jgi:hypothetical protein